MKLTNSIKSIAIGSFDGIHKAHRALINQVEAIVIIERNGGYLTTGYKRSLFVTQSCFFYHFEKIKSLSAKEFVLKLKEDFPKLEKIVVGYDFAFGYKKDGSASLLKELFDGDVVIVTEVKEQGLSVHTRVIKNFLFDGNIKLTTKLLGRPFVICGNTVKGQGLGKKELFPTLNLKVYDYALAKNGVYATRTKIDDFYMDSITFLGHRVSTDGSFAVETHILDKNISVSKGKVYIEFIDFIRENKKFDSLDALKQQIAKDIEEAKKHLDKGKK